MIYDGSTKVLNMVRQKYPKSCHYMMMSKTGTGEYVFDFLNGQPLLAIYGKDFLALFEIGADVPEEWVR